MLIFFNKRHRLENALLAYWPEQHCCVCRMENRLGPISLLRNVTATLFASRLPSETKIGYDMLARAYNETTLRIIGIDAFSINATRKESGTQNKQTKQKQFLNYFSSVRREVYFFPPPIFIHIDVPILDSIMLF